MATKQILGDDPFAPNGAPPPAPDAPVVAKKPAAPSRAEARSATKASTPTEAETRAKAKPSAATKAPTATPAPTPAPTGPAAETQAAAPADPPTQSDSAANPDYGPSIDQPPPTAHRSSLVEEVHELERRVRDRLLPAAQTEPERQRPALEFFWKRWRELAMRDRSDVVDQFGRDPQVSAKLEPILEFLYRSYFRVQTRGLGHIPDEGRALIVGNHSGTLPYDGAMIMHAVRREHPAHRELRPLVEDFVFHFPYLGTLMNRIGGVRACPENAERLLAEEQLVAVFPEGIKGIGKLFSERYRLQRFGRGGFIKLALKCDAPIIPTAVVGAEEIHPMVSKVTWMAKTLGLPYLPLTPTFPWLGPLGLVPLPTKWFIAFGEPLYFNAEYGAEAANDRILVNRLAEQVRARIQEMIDELLGQRQSVLFG